MTALHSAPRSSRNHFREPPSLSERAQDTLTYVTSKTAPYYRTYAPLEWLRSSKHRWRVRDIFTIAHILAFVWIVALYRSERSAFNNAIAQCEWSTWERWPKNANPHHLIFVADPQLVDPHTYPGRPWPLSTLTVRYTDLYMRRVYRRLQQNLYPDTVFFLGDLFDGGREWSTTESTSPEKQWQKYGDTFWLKEYKRFHNIFFKYSNAGGYSPRSGQQGRRIIDSLPGNHDLGFAGGVQLPVRQRFNAYFGEGNRIDVIANHTFVSLDTVSLSAMGGEGVSEDVWKPTQDFLDDIKVKRKEAIAREMRRQSGLRTHPLYQHQALETDELAEDRLPAPYQSDGVLPTILLTHVPLYRSPGTPCGPQREHWPPTPPPKGQKDPVEPDDRNAITVAAGYQYQNVLTREISKDITEKIGDIRYAFSGDDHDYCEVVHRSYPSGGAGIREITVKSISLAMGVRVPGFEMLSMWNEVDGDGNSLQDSGLGSPSSTLQTHLCLLPDTLGLLLGYAKLLVLTLVLLGARAVYMVRKPAESALSGEQEVPLLPVSKTTSSAEAEKAEAGQFRSQRDSSDAGSSASSASSGSGQKLSARYANARTRSASPGGYGLPGSELPSNVPLYGVPLIDKAGYFGPAKPAGGDGWVTSARAKPKKLRGLALLSAEFKASFLRVALIALPWYFWLLWNG